MARRGHVFVYVCLCLGCSLHLGWSFQSPVHRQQLQHRRSVSTQGLHSSVMGDIHSDYIRNVAKFDAPMPALGTLLKLLQMQGRKIFSPEYRPDLNPFLIPLSEGAQGGTLCLLRWPTQPSSMPLQVVETTPCGVRLVSSDVSGYIKRLAIEADYANNPDADAFVKLANSALSPDNIHPRGSFWKIKEKGKSRYVLLNVGPFLDAYQDISDEYIAKKDIVSALVTCERAINVFYGWGSPLSFHARTLALLGNRGLEAVDAARAATRMPLWTIADTEEDREYIVRLAGYSSIEILRDMCAFRANDPQDDNKTGGKAPEQISLDRAAYLMDAVALGYNGGSWDATREELALRYTEGGLPDIARFIQSH